MTFFQEIEIAFQHKEMFLTFFFIIGACLGSFFNVVAFRYPIMMDSSNAKDIDSWLEEKKITVPNALKDLQKEINLSFPASHCYSCSNTLKWYHNIPILSYLFLRGKCGFCKTPYSIQYPIVEFIGGLLLATIYNHYFFNYGINAFMLASIFFVIGYLLLIIDFKTLMLPDGLNYFLLWTGFLFATFDIYLVNNVLITDLIWGSIIGFLILWTLSRVGEKIKGVSVMGDGDLKLIAAIGAFIGFKGVIFTIFLSPFIGILTWLYFKLRGNKEPEFPYGPALILSSWIYLYNGKGILNYLNIPL